MVCFVIPLVLAIVAGLLAWGVWHLGSRMPPGHVAARCLQLRQPLQTVWDVVRDFAGAHGGDVHRPLGVWHRAGRRRQSVTIIERGEIPNPYIRFIFRTFMNPAVHLEKYLKALAAKFGEPETPVREPAHHG